MKAINTHPHQPIKNFCGAALGTPSGRLAGLLSTLNARADDLLGETSVIRRCYAVSGTTAAVTLASTDRGAVAAVDRLYRGTYTVTVAAPARWTVEITLLEPRALAPVGYAFAGGVAVDTGSGVSVKRMPTPAGTLFATDDDHALIDTDLQRGRIRVWVDQPRAAQFWAPELVRQAITAQLRADGAVHAQAVAVRVAGTDILIAGAAGTGKTTVLLACLRRLRGDLVAGTRVLLSRDTNGLLGRPWPAPMTIASGSLLPYPELRMMLGGADPRAQATSHTLTVPGDQTDLLLAGGITRPTIRPRLVFWPHVALDKRPNESEVPRSSEAWLDPDKVQRTLIRTRLWMYEVNRGPSAYLDDWISEPLPPTVPRPITDELRAVVDGLAQLETHWIHVTRDPLDICGQITALLPTVPIRAASTPFGDDHGRPAPHRPR